MPDVCFRKDGRIDWVLLAACVDPGGIFCFDGDRIEKIDPIPSSSVAIAGDRIVRLRWSEAADSSGLFVYSPLGLEKYHCLEGLGDAHQVAWDRGHFIVASTATNSIVWISPSGERHEWRAAGEGDAWHLNGIWLEGEDVFLSAFGRFAQHRGWNAHRKDGSGIVFNLHTGADVISGLNCPHHPRHIDGTWVLCSSADHQLLEIAEGVVRRRVQLSGWTRGLAISDDFMFVGISAPRHDPASGRSEGSLAIVSRSTWDVECVLPIDSREISDLVLVPASLAEGIRRATDYECFGLFPGSMRDIGTPLPGSLSLDTAGVPARAGAGQRFECAVAVGNGSGHLLRSLAPNPVHLSYQWVEEDTKSVVVADGLRTPLCPPLRAHTTGTYAVRVQAPEQPGRYRLVLTLVQEGVRWFHEPPIGLRSDHVVEVGW